MKYTISWGKLAERSLTKIWLDAEHRDRVTAAANEIERTLHSAPHDAGESRDGGRRILMVSPLAVTFGVAPGSRTVRVSRAWRTDRRRGRRPRSLESGQSSVGSS